MKRILLILALAGVLCGGIAVVIPTFSQAPPVGSGGQVQTKTGNYTVKSTDLKTTLSFNCPSPCTATMPQSTASWPKGYPVTILNSGTTTVTVHITPTSTVSGMVPPGSSDILLTAQGNYAVVTADRTNNYVAYGVTGVGGGGPPPTGGGSYVLRNSGGHVARNSGGAVLRNATGGVTTSLVLRNSSGHVARNSGGSVERNGP